MQILCRGPSLQDQIKSIFKGKSPVRSKKEGSQNWRSEGHQPFLQAGPRPAPGAQAEVGETALAGAPLTAQNSNFLRLHRKVQSVVAGS